MLNSSSCSEFSSQDNFLSQRYFPAWRGSLVQDFLHERQAHNTLVAETDLKDTEVFPEKKGYFHMNVARMKGFEIAAELKYEFVPNENSSVKITKELLQNFTDWSRSQKAIGGDRTEGDIDQAASAVTWLLTRQLLKHQVHSTH